MDYDNRGFEQVSEEKLLFFIDEMKEKMGGVKIYKGGEMRRKRIRRKVYSLDYFNAGGRERRQKDRRCRAKRS